MCLEQSLFDKNRTEPRKVVWFFSASEKRLQAVFLCFLFPNLVSSLTSFTTSFLRQALERHREISDIVRIERDQLTDEVVQLRDSLKVPEKPNYNFDPAEIQTPGDEDPQVFFQDRCLVCLPKVPLPQEQQRGSRSGF